MTYHWNFSGIQAWRTVQADRHGRATLWVKPGWYLRETSPDGIISLFPLTGWRLFRHRLLWGFTRGLVDAR